MEKPLALDKGVYLLNGGNEADGPGGLTRINEDGSVTTRLFEDVNGHPIGKRVRCMAAYGDDIYFLCSTFKSIGFAEDTILVVADAKTLKEKRAYKFKDLSFDMPEGTKPEDEPFPSDPESIYVLDEANIFIKDEQALIRFDSQANKAYLMEGSYHIANYGATLEPLVLSKAIRHNGKLYYAMGGFWHKQPGLVEVKRNTTALGREVTFSAPGEYVPGGIVADAEGNFWLSVFWTRRPKVGYFIKVDPKEMKELESVTVNEFISPGYDPTHGISIDGDYIYLMGVQSLNTEFYYERSGVIRRFNLKTKRLEKAGDVFKDVPEVQFIGCNPIIDSRTHLLYIPGQTGNGKNGPDDNYQLIYDCSGAKPVLKEKIQGKTSNIRYIFIN